MAALNLPEFDIKVRQGRGRLADVYDPLRCRWVALTPEEWVRQHFVNFLITAKGYPRAWMANEVSLSLNGTARRADTVVYDSHRRPLAVIEYKAPNVPITQAVFDQVARYHMVIGAPLLMVSNGLKHYCCRRRTDSSSYDFLTDIPQFADIDPDGQNM